MKMIVLLASIMLLTACSSGTLEYIHTCPVPKDYTAEEKQAAKAEGLLVPKDGMIANMLEDYAVLKQQSLDCQKVK